MMMMGWKNFMQTPPSYLEQAIMLRQSPSSLLFHDSIIVHPCFHHRNTRKRHRVDHVFKPRTLQTLFRRRNIQHPRLPLRESLHQRPRASRIAAMAHLKAPTVIEDPRSRQRHGPTHSLDAHRSGPPSQRRRHLPGHGINST